MTLELDWSAGRIGGTIGLPGSVERRFTGYVELIAALEETRSGSTAPAPSDASRRATTTGSNTSDPKDRT